MHTSIHLDEFDHDLTSFLVTGMMVGWSLINHPQMAVPEASAVFRWLNYYDEGPDTIVLDKIRLQYMNFTWHEFYTTYIYVNAYIYIYRFSKSSFSCYHRSFLCVDILVLSARLFFDDCLWWLGRNVWMAVDPPKFPLGLSEDSGQNP